MAWNFWRKKQPPQPPIGAGLPPELAAIMQAVANGQLIPIRIPYGPPPMQFMSAKNSLMLTVEGDQEGLPIKLPCVQAIGLILEREFTGRYVSKAFMAGDPDPDEIVGLSVKFVRTIMETQLPKTKAYELMLKMNEMAKEFIAKSESGEDTANV